MKGRAYRRWRRALKIRKAERIKKENRQLGSGRVIEHWRGYTVHEAAARRADNMSVCSNFCCGNPRKHFGQRTVQEQRMGGS